MPAHLYSAALRGIEAVPVEVEVDVLPGLPSFTVVGMTDKAIQEARERMTAALSNMGYEPPRRKTIVSLAPASLKKEGSMYDLPITLGYLMASGQIQVKKSLLDSAWFIGEVGLDTIVRPVPGVLPIVLAAAQAGIHDLYIPSGNKMEAAALGERMNIYAVHNVQEIIDHLAAEDEKPLKVISPDEVSGDRIENEIDFGDIKGQEQAKRALSIAAAGLHNVLMVGPPGTGKTLLARALPGILPPLTLEESYTVTSIYSVAGELKGEIGLMRQRPFRDPHYGASSVALIGGGANSRPGEVSLAHTGVLFLDELPEYSRSVLDQLRQPIEDGFVSVARAAQTIRYPARSMLIGAMNPCKCGFLGSQRRECRCSPADVMRYQRKISGPLLDRFDIHVVVADVPVEELITYEPGERMSNRIAEAVAIANQKQIIRQGKPNSRLTARDIHQYAVVDGVTKKLLVKAEEKFHLSARGVHRLLKVARTIADMAGEEQIGASHIAEALAFREQLTAYLPDFV